MLRIAREPQVERIPLPALNGEHFMVKIGAIGCQNEHIRSDRDGFFILSILRAVLKGDFAPFKIVIQVDECSIFAPWGVIWDEFCSRACTWAKNSESPLVFAMNRAFEVDIIGMVGTVIESDPGIESTMIELIAFAHERIALVHQLNHLI